MSLFYQVKSSSLISSADTFGSFECVPAGASAPPSAAPTAVTSPWGSFFASLATFTGTGINPASHSFDNPGGLSAYAFWCLQSFHNQPAS